MSLPSLPSLDDDFFGDVKKEKKENKNNVHKKKESNRKKQIIPKTSYDAEGRPILSIPDLNDKDLSAELDRFFGNKEEI